MKSSFIAALTLLRTNARVRAAASRWAPIWAIAVAVSLAAGCLDDNITGVRPLTLTLTVEPATAAVGDSITFRYAATGTELFAIALDYGDGKTGSVPLLGGLAAVELTGFLKHAYGEAATYVATGIATDNTGTLSRQVTVQITGG